MLLAVKFYARDNPQGIPSDWPSDVVELRDSSSRPRPPWVVMTPEEYADYLKKHRPAYEAWEAKQSLETYRAEKIKRCAQELTAYVESRYSATQQMTLNSLLAEAIYTGNTRRADYIVTAIQWIKSMLVEYYKAKAKCLAAVDGAELQAINVDYSFFDSSDPLVEIAKASVME